MAEEGLVDEKVLVKFAQKLAGNEKKFRDRTLRKLRKFLESRSRSPKGERSLEFVQSAHICHVSIHIKIHVVLGRI